MGFSRRAKTVTSNTKYSRYNLRNKSIKVKYNKSHDSSRSRIHSNSLKSKNNKSSISKKRNKSSKSKQIMMGGEPIVAPLPAPAAPRPPPLPPRQP